MEEDYFAKIWGGARGLVSCLVRDGYETGLWKAIRRKWGGGWWEWKTTVGNGRRIKFWQDVWCNVSPFSVSFRSLLLQLLGRLWLHMFGSFQVKDDIHTLVSLEISRIRSWIVLYIH